VVTNRLVRRCIDGKYFNPVAFGTYSVLRKLYKNLVYQPFIRPFKYLRRKPRYEELHPEDEVTLPRNAMATDLTTPAPAKAATAVRSAPGVWTVPQVNKHASRRRGYPMMDPKAMAAAEGAKDGPTERSLEVIQD